MAQRTGRRTKRDHDFGVNAIRVVLEATVDHTPPTEEKPLDTTGKHPNAVALGC